MAIIGLYDYDMSHYIYTPFNLELMKLSRYFKNKRDIVSLMYNIDLTKYSKIYYHKDYYDGKFDSEILSNDKIIFGGYSFSNFKYLPMDLSIEKSIPDTEIYKIFEEQFNINKKYKNIFNTMTRAHHFRFSLDEKNIWENYTKQINFNLKDRCLFIHDYNLANIEGAWEELQKLANYNNKEWIGVKFPIKPDNFQDLLKWITVPSLVHFYNIYYDNWMTDSEIYELVNTPNISKNVFRNIRYNFINQFNSTQDLVENLPKIYKQLVYLRMNKIQIPLIYNQDKFDYTWTRLLTLIKLYYNFAFKLKKDDFNRTIKFDSMYNFVYQHCKDSKQDLILRWGLEESRYILKPEARELFHLAQQECYELFQLFYECHTVRFDGGEFKVD